MLRKKIMKSREICEHKDIRGSVICHYFPISLGFQDFSLCSCVSAARGPWLCQLITGCVSPPPHASGVWSVLLPGLCFCYSPGCGKTCLGTSDRPVGQGGPGHCLRREFITRGKRGRHAQVYSRAKPQGSEGRGESESCMNPRQRHICR